MRKGEKLVTRIMDMIDEKQEIQKKIYPSSQGIDKNCVRALTFINILSMLDDEQLERLLK